MRVTALSYLLSTLFVLIIIFLTFSSCSHNHISKEYIIKKHLDKNTSSQFIYPICLYSSTLRMINISNNNEFNELVNNIEKVLIYNLDSIDIAEGTNKIVIEEYKTNGFDELITVTGPQTIYLLNKKNEYVGSVQIPDHTLCFYIKGKLPFNKLLQFIQTFDSQEFSSVITEQLL